MFVLFPVDENFPHQTGQVTNNFHLPGSFDTHIGEWASTKRKPCISDKLRACYTYNYVDFMMPLQDFASSKIPNNNHT